MANVTYDDRSILVDGQRIWLVSGSVQYFRIPSALWRDALLKAKRGGLNCISTCIAWNYHEVAEGRWETTGEKDIGNFIRIAADLGLYVILRPGPFIGADWDFGGLPAWLTTKTGMTYRTNSGAYTHYFDKYFRQILPPLAELQVTRGGNIILIQNENEYDQTVMPDRLSYLGFISQLFRRSGFDIPIITSNDLSSPPLPESIETVAGQGDIVPALKRLQLRQSGGPKLASELRTGSPDVWGGEHRVSPPTETARLAMEVLGCGGQFNYHIYHGGTNFGFWAGRLGNSQPAYQVTSYDLDAPIAEGGGLTEKYYFTRLVNMLACHMGQFLSGCRCPWAGATIHDSPSVSDLSGPNGSWVIVSNNGCRDVQTATVSLPDGPRLTVPLGTLGAAAIPYKLALAADKQLDYANLTPLGMFGEKIIVFHAPAGWAARISINGKEIQAKVPKGDEPLVIDHDGLLVLLVSSDLGSRTWFVDGALVFGPAFVGETLDDIVHAPGAKQCMLLSPDGKATHRKAANGAPRPAPPKLKEWKRQAVCTEPSAGDMKWNKLNHPVDLDKLGVYQGYAWYRLVWDEPRARKRSLMLPDCEDRATLFLNGSLLGVWERQGGRPRSPIVAQVVKGANTMVILADNLGRHCRGLMLGELKGLWGPICEVKEMPIRKFALTRLDKFPRRVVPRMMSHLIPELEYMPAWSLDVDFGLSQVAPIHFSFAGVPHHAAVLCNDRVMGFYPCCGANFGDLMLTAALRKGKNAFRLLLWGDVQAGVADKLRFDSLQETLDAAVSWRPWQMPVEGGPVVGKDQPAWYTTSFHYTPSDSALFLHVAGAKKGQVFLNGHNLGRFWTVGPQQHYYLPRCWLGQTNELLLFEDQGNLPRRTRLDFCPAGPYRT